MISACRLVLQADVAELRAFFDGDAAEHIGPARRRRSAAVAIAFDNSGAGTATDANGMAQVDQRRRADGADLDRTVQRPPLGAVAQHAESGRASGRERGWQ